MIKHNQLNIAVCLINKFLRKKRKLLVWTEVVLKFYSKSVWSNYQLYNHLQMFVYPDTVCSYMLSISYFLSLLRLLVLYLILHWLRDFEVKKGQIERYFLFLCLLRPVYTHYLHRLSFLTLVLNWVFVLTFYVLDVNCCSIVTPSGFLKLHI